MITSDICWKKYGDPKKESSMMVWNIPVELQQGKIPKKIYCNRQMVQPLTKAFQNLIDRELVDELKTWDGCFCIRSIRGGTDWSIHSWGLAVDLNAAENPLGAEPKLSREFVLSFTDAGLSWGGDWTSRVDGMHFQLAQV
jgi:hypothetical protein